MRQSSRCVAVTLIGLLLLPPQIHARPLTPDPHAPAHLRPGMDKAPNGVPVVNVTNPSAAGLSHNLYQDFNVNKQGVIFNNSRTAVQTQLGGITMGNPNFNGAPARTILNEVTSSNRSHIAGYMEVGGQKADLILANPNGITVNGGGFINVGHGAFTTGKPLVNNGALSGFEVRQGTVRVEGMGLDASQTNSASILSRAAEIAADVHAQNLTVVSGKNRIEGNTVTPLAVSPDEVKPEVAVDSALLGGMYANRIMLIATEKGVGVNLEGMVQSTKDLEITADGKLVLRKAAAGGDAALASNTRVRVKESAYAGNNLSVDSPKVTSGGVLAAGNAVRANAKKVKLDGALVVSGMDASGTVRTSGDVRVTAKKLKAANTQIASGGSTTVQAKKASLDSVKVSSGNAAIFTANELAATNTEVNATDIGMALATARLINASFDAQSDMELHTASLAMDTVRASAGRDFSLSFNDLRLPQNSAFASGGDLLLQGDNLTLVGGFLAAGNDLRYAGTSLNNVGGVLYAGRDQRLNVSTLLNDSGEIHAGRDIVIAGRTGDRADSVRNLSGIVSAGEDLAISANTVENAKRDFAVAWRGRHLGTSKRQQCNPQLLGHGCNRRIQIFTTNVFEDYILRDSPAADMFAAGDIYIDADSFANRYSRVAAGSALVTEAGSVVNEDALLQRTTAVRETFLGWDSDGDFTGEFFLASYESYEQIGRAPSVLSADSDLYINATDSFSNLSNRQGIALANTSGDSGPAMNYASTLADSPMFRPVTTPGGRYRIETNPLFTNFGHFFGSDYFFSRMGIHNLDSLQTRLLGDAFYETRLVQEQIMAATGRRFLEGFSTDADQMRGLMDNAAAEAGGLQLSLGVELSPAQVAALTHDIIWLVEEDYMGETVLVPRLYLASATADDIMPDGGLRAKNVYVNAGKGVINEGIISGNSVNVVSLNIANNGGLLRGGTLNLAAVNDIFNNSGSMLADNIHLQAGGDIVSQTLQRTDPGHADNKQRMAQAGMEARQNFTAVAGNDIVLTGSALRAGNDATLSAGRDLTVTTVTDEFHLNHGGKLQAARVTHTGSAISAGGNLNMTARRDMTLAGSQASAGGDAMLVAGKNISVVSVQDSFRMSARMDSRSGGLLGGSSKSSVSREIITNKASGVNAGGNLTLQAGTRTRGVTQGDGNIAVIGSNLGAAGDLRLTATGDILALSGQNRHSQSSSKSSSGLLSSSSKASGSSSLTQVASNLLGVNITLDAGKNVTLQASNLGAANDAALIARDGDVRLLDAQNVTSSWSKSSSSGFGIGGGGGLLSLYGSESKRQTSMSANSAGSTMSSTNANVAAGRDVVIVSGRLAAANDLGINAGRDVNILAGENTRAASYDKKTQAVGIGGVFSLEKVDLFAGMETKASGKREHTSSVSGSTLSAGNNMSIQAGNNINVEAGKFAAGNDIGMLAGNDVNLLQGENTRHTDEYKSQLRAGLNLTLQQNLTTNAQKVYNSASKALDGAQDTLGTATSIRNIGQGVVDTVENSRASASLTLGVSGSRSSSSTSSSTAVVTEIQAGHDAGILAGRDVNMEGARLVTGNDAVVAAGRDINIRAATSRASGSQSESSFSAGAGLGATAGTSGAAYGLTVSAALGEGRGKHTAIIRQNAEMTAGGVLSTLSGRDSMLSGANLLGDQVDMYVGRNLLVESVRDYARSSSQKTNVGANLTIGIGATSGEISNSASGNLGYQTGIGKSDFIGQQTSIIGAQGVNIFTADNTHIKGAVIAALNDNLVLNTGTLSFEDMTGKKTATGIGFGLKADYGWKSDSGGKAANTNTNTTNANANVPNTPEQADASKNANANINSEQLYTTPDWLSSLQAKVNNVSEPWSTFKKTTIVSPDAFTYKNNESTQEARATVGGGTIIVRDNPGMDISGLNRDPAQSMTVETNKNISVTLDPLYSYVDTVIGTPGKILEQLDGTLYFFDNPKIALKDIWEGILKAWGRDPQSTTPEKF